MRRSPNSVVIQRNVDSGPARELFRQVISSSAFCWLRSFQLVEAHYEDVKSVCFEKTVGRWRGFTNTVVARYTRFASPECDFARLPSAPGRIDVTQNT